MKYESVDDIIYGVAQYSKSDKWKILTVVHYLGQNTTRQIPFVLRDNKIPGKVEKEARKIVNSVSDKELKCRLFNLTDDALTVYPDLKSAALMDARDYDLTILFEIQELGKRITESLFEISRKTIDDDAIQEIITNSLQSEPKNAVPIQEFHYWMDGWLKNKGYEGNLARKNTCALVMEKKLQTTPDRSLYYPE